MWFYIVCSRFQNLLVLDCREGMRSSWQLSPLHYRGWNLVRGCQFFTESRLYRIHFETCAFSMNISWIWLRLQNKIDDKITLRLILLIFSQYFKMMNKINNWKASKRMETFQENSWILVKLTPHTMGNCLRPVRLVRVSISNPDLLVITISMCGSCKGCVPDRRVILL